MAFQGITMPPPSGGLDLVTPIDSMAPETALELVNVFPGAGAPTVRLGYQQFAYVGVSAPIKTLTTLNLKDGTSRLIAATDTKLYAITSGGTVSDITKASPHTNGDFQFVTFGNNLYLCNGVDSAQVWTGTGVAINVTFTGVTLANLSNVTAYKNRLYFVEKNTAKVWYGDFQVTGTAATPALTSFDFQYVFNRGGNLLAIGSFSTSTSMSAQEYFWACSSKGEIVFFNGTFAGDATTWGLVARYFIGEPLGPKAFVRCNNDIYVITQQGIVPLSGLFISDPQASLNILSRNVNPIISDTATTFGADGQWTGFFWPQGRRVYFQIPTSGSGNYFLVYAIDTKAWTIFRLYDDQHVLSSCEFENLPYYASSTGVIWKGETGQADAVTSTDSQAITFSGRSAFSFYGSRANYKAFKDIRPILKVKRGITLNLGLDTDFKRASLDTTATIPSGSFTPWGSPWDSPWSAGTEFVFDRFAVKGQGHCAAIRFGGGVKNSTMQIIGFEVRYDLGGQV
jgi:hypothetical protein